MRRWLGLALAGATIAIHIGCAHPAIVLPSGPGAPAPDADTAWAEATMACRATKTLSAELRVSGRAGSQKLKATILAGITAADQIRLEMPAPFGRPAFVLAGTNAQSTLVTRDDRVLTARADQIVEGLTGLPFGPRALLAVLSGCGVDDTTRRDARRYEDTIAIDTASGRVFLRQTAGRWSVLAAEIADLTIAYERSAANAPLTLHITSAAGHTPAVTLSVSEHQVETNTSLPASAFAVAVPPTASPMTLDDLRAAGPLGERRP